MKKILFFSFICFLNVFILSFLPTCYSTAKIKQNPSFSGKNRLVFNNLDISLPAGWSFHQTIIDDKEVIVLQFYDKEKTVYGTYEYIKFDFRTDKEKVANYYNDEILKHIADKQVSKISIGRETGYIISTWNDKAELNSKILVLTNNFKESFIIELVAPEGHLPLNAELANKILGSCTLEYNYKTMRVIEQGPEFYCYDGSWTWLDDCAKGFYIRGRIDTSECIIGIWQTDYSSTKELYNNIGDFSIPAFTAHFFINNLKINTQGLGYQNEYGFTKLYYIINYHDKHYCIFISFSNMDLSVAAESIHQHQAIIDLFRYCLIFN